MKKPFSRTLLLSIVTIISIVGCFPFGFLLTGYGHGGQIMGIPFTMISIIIMVVFSTLQTETKKEKVFIFGMTYFLTLLAFSLTVILFKFNLKDISYIFLYEYNAVFPILIFYLVVGLFIAIRKIRKLKNQPQA